MKKFFMSIANGLNVTAKLAISILVSIVAIVIYLPFHLFFPIFVFGRKNLKAQNKNGRLFVCNHFSCLDVIFVTVFVCPIKRMKFLAKKELNKNKFVGWFLSAFGAVYIDRQNIDLQAIKKISATLKKNKTIAIFPEGTRNKTGTDDLQSIKSGVIMFSNISNANIIPARFESRPKLFRFNKIIIGKQYLPIRGNKQQIAEETKILSEKMKSLSNK